METDLDDAVNDIISQLKGNVAAPKRETQDVPLTKDQLEDFIIKSSGKLVSKSLNIVEDVQEYVASAPDAKDVSALAELINATSSAIDTLNKVYISDERNKTQVRVKLMDVESRERMNITDNKTKILLSREDIMNALVNNDESIIDI
jgi:hypothetical protein